MPIPPWHPDSLAARMPFLRRRALLTQAVRAFFAARGYTEVETPYAVPAPGEEVHLRAFRTVQENVDGSERPLWLLCDASQKAFRVMKEKKTVNICQRTEWIVKS